MDKKQHMDEGKTSRLEDIARGVGKHDSLANAGLYSLFSDLDMVDFLTEKIQERSRHIYELMKLNDESGHMLLPEIPHDRIGAFEAIEKLAVTNPGAHELLGKIAELDKLRFLVSDKASAKH